MTINSNSTFADRLQASIERSQSFIIAGCDPVLETFPDFLINEARKKCLSDDDAIIYAIKNYYISAAQELHTKIAAVKPNIAFFEQYGLPGLRAFVYLCDEIRNLKLPLVVDAKRGDIGSTAKAYSSAFLGQAGIFGNKKSIFNCDALTVNPYLGFDTVDVFLNDCLEHGKGIFILVKTSNPGSKDIQDIQANSGSIISQTVAGWIGKNAEKLIGKCGYSGLGAVVGATHPEQAIQLRKNMPTSIFLIPGMGAQGGTANDAVQGFAKIAGKPGGAIVNISRGIFSDIPKECDSWEKLKKIWHQRVDKFNSEIRSACEQI